ncbi:tRNA nucleotidyltransferase [hydrothermal vent metagenome]|uniref:tRNA nucleotidyltransferase n=1 Tax=hydrothermal vent metagenome TaxID=652676 RepID=A0A1W1CQQ9_9ZZZZ
MQIPQILHSISSVLQTHGARAVLVGGAVRDAVMNLPVKDYDIEVYGIADFEALAQLLEPFGRVNTVGKSFGVLKLCIGGEVYDFALPRTERKTGTGHRGFEVTVDGSLDFATAAKRRDFTVNALGFDIQSDEIIDPFGGMDDMGKKILRHIDDATFAEDPLRVYRAVQFAARFDMQVAEETAMLCRRMVAARALDELPRERVYEEWKKLLLKAYRPSKGFELMHEWGITKKYFPELHALSRVPQNPKWHPEGDVWVHTMLSIDAMRKLIEDALALDSERVSFPEKKQLKLMFAALCHDFGKPLTTSIEYDNGEVISWEAYRHTIVSQETKTGMPYSVRALGHEEAGLEPTRNLMYRLTDEHDFIESILPLVAHHLKPSQFYKQGAKAPAVRRLAVKVNIEELVLVAKADFLGRTTPEAKTGRYAAGEWLLEKAKALKVWNKPMNKLVQGRDLIALGMKPSPEFGKILNEVYEKQLDGEIASKEDAEAYIREEFQHND